MTSGRVRIGVSGWSYPAWRGDFYPAELVQREELSYLAQHLETVETNGTFYSLQRPSSFHRWHDATPAGFRFALKGGRFVTHLKRLVDVERGLANFFASGVLVLGPRLGSVLWQLPPTLAFDAEVVDRFCRLLPRTTAAAADLARHHDLAADRAEVPGGTTHRLRHAVEPRHASFAAPEAVELLRRHRVATVLSDNPGHWPVLDEDTAGFRYVRLHGHTELYASGYSRTSLEHWAERCRAWSAAGQDVDVFFDNDAHGRAPHDALALKAMVGTP